MADDHDVLREALARIEQIARENENLKRDLAELRERFSVLALNVGMRGNLLRLTALLREWRSQPTPENRDAMFRELDFHDDLVFGPEGPGDMQAKILRYRHEPSGPS